MKRYRKEQLNPAELKLLCKRPGAEYSEILPVLNNVLQEVLVRGDNALREFTKKFDNATVSEFRVSENEFEQARSCVSQKTKDAILSASDAIKKYHECQLPKPFNIKTEPGVECWMEWRAIQRVGLYIPGGSAPLISTVLMLGIPATIAGCNEIILCTPPSSNGSISSEILFAGESLGIKNVFKVGGAQAITALAVGTESIHKVDKIFGPGNRYVSAMKSLVAQPPTNVSIDMIAGPTELLIIADETSNPAWIAADLLSQAEHGADSQVVLVTTSELLAEHVEKEIAHQLTTLPRHTIAEEALEKSFVLVVKDLDDAFEFSNEYAPEHLSVAIENAEIYSNLITNAGSVFMGTRSSVVFGDYASGTNHTLPTSGFAKSVGGITVQNFMKPIFFQSISELGLSSLGEIVTTLARAERLEAHAQAIEKRIGKQ